MAGGVCHTLGDRDGIRQEGTDFPAALAQGDIVIVGADLNRPVETIEGHSDFLSVTEQCRAKEYVRDCDRILFIRRRIVLRRLLGTILGRNPRGIVIRTDPAGKPFVAPEGRYGPLSFSVSHSRDRAIFVFACQRQVGIDLEYRDPAIETLKMAGIICSYAEQVRLDALPFGDRLEAFYDCWCAKEAFVKAAGVREPTSFEVSFWPNQPGLVWDRGIPRDLRRWSFHRLNRGADWSAMLVVEGDCQAFGVMEIDENRVPAL
jgi:4'-phosphopantetheinyl transferase